MSLQSVVKLVALQSTIPTIYKFCALSGFQLVDLIIMELKDHMICYNSMPLIGWNYSIQHSVQIL